MAVLIAITGPNGSISAQVRQSADMTRAAEQGTASADIARTIEQASAGTREVTANIAVVADQAAVTGRMAEEVHNAADNLREESDSLEREVRQFLDAVARA
jgi:methyl-accepting chemotaxis protein